MSRIRKKSSNKYRIIFEQYNMNEKITIRPATTNDVDEIFEINSQTWLDTYASEEYDIWERDISNWWDNDKRENAMKNRAEEISQNPWAYHVATFEWKVIGYTWGRKHEQYNELFAIYILNTFQGKGIWTMLIPKVFEYLWNEKPIMVNVIWYNQKAIKFYEKIGFRFHKKLDDFELLPWKLVPEIQMIYSQT